MEGDSNCYHQIQLRIDKFKSNLSDPSFNGSNIIVLNWVNFRLVRFGHCTIVTSMMSTKMKFFISSILFVLVDLAMSHLLQLRILRKDQRKRYLRVPEKKHQLKRLLSSSHMLRFQVFQII